MLCCLGTSNSSSSTSPPPPPPSSSLPPPSSPDLQISKSDFKFANLKFSDLRQSENLPSPLKLGGGLQRGGGRVVASGAVGDVCMGELTKLRAKIRVRNPLIFLKSHKRDSQKAAAAEEEEIKESKQESKPRNEEIMSETTVLLLMDRFAPC
ncbi:hypothetical protein BUALT_Bualt15G0030800 [Buddleja alternifolia]|uniref:Uncharacterized protein n=1 Tax=Buddleja alternifolia TaxID=168488 RepID=A0AAV6WLB1_9LAMI|nr:hypothetical protein BUALT_Bualt15G0030800 [Buddleja alternifolia]